MRSSREKPQSEHSVDFSGYIMLECQCGERLVLLGREEDWYSEGRTVFECWCGRMLTLADRLDEEATSEEASDVRELLRKFRSPDEQ